MSCAISRIVSRAPTEVRCPQAAQNFAPSPQVAPQLRHTSTDSTADSVFMGTDMSARAAHRRRAREGVLRAGARIEPERLPGCPERLRLARFSEADFVGLREQRRAHRERTVMPR